MHATNKYFAYWNSQEMSACVCTKVAKRLSIVKENWFSLCLAILGQMHDITVYWENDIKSLF